jgi:hypothetical protein
MRYKDIEKINDEEFERIVGVKRRIFFKMVEVYKKNKPKVRGEKPKLSEEDHVLVLLRYYRYHDTCLKISYDYNVAESTISRIITKLEKILIKDKNFHLPNKKELLSNNLETVIIDASESLIERPKKTKKMV